MLGRRLILNDSTTDAEPQRELDGERSAESRPILDYGSIGSRNRGPARLRNALGRRDLTEGCFAGLIYTFLATILLLAGIQSVSPNVRLVALGFAVVIPCAWSLRRKSWRPFAAGVLIAIGLGVLLLGICGAIIGAHF
jgi:hypothetical protein